MKVVDPGHVYDLNFLDGDPKMAINHAGGKNTVLYENRLTFVKREGEKYPGNVGEHAGTQIQEVCRALIDRLRYVNGQEHDARTCDCIGHLQYVILLLESRAANRHGRSLSGVNHRGIEELSTCTKCGHIGCTGGCH